jgi:hypothetical protein
LYAPVVGNPFSEEGSASSQPGLLVGYGKVLNRYRKESSGKEREGEEGEEEEESSESEGEDSEMEEDATAPRLGTARDVVDESRERTADSTENSGTDGSGDKSMAGRTWGRDPRHLG